MVPKLFKLEARLYFCDILSYTHAILYSRGVRKSGLRAKCGPWSNFVRPAASAVEHITQLYLASSVMMIDHCAIEIFFFLVGFVEKRLWWPIQSLNTGGKKKASS